jgi:membrane associated rhomboid family serine protease
MIVMVAITAALALGFIAVLRLFAAIITHKTMRQAIESKPELAEGLLERITHRRERQGDDRLALVLIAIGIAMALAAVIATDDWEDIRVAIAAALFPLLVGGTLWFRFRAIERARVSDRAE